MKPIKDISHARGRIKNCVRNVQKIDEMLKSVHEHVSIEASHIGKEFFVSTYTKAKMAGEKLEEAVVLLEQLHEELEDL